jgi:hypothetical protein
VLQLNNGKDANGEYSFSEVGQLAGIYKTDWSWSPLLVDLDNDGWKDLFITNGIPKDITNNDFVSYRGEVIQANTGYDEQKKNLLLHVEKLAPVDKPNFVFKNNGDLSFTDKSADWGLNKKGFSNGAAYADLDNDGDLDLVTNNINAPASVFRNNADSIIKNNFLRIRLNGSNTAGTKVTLYSGDKKQYSENNVFRGFQSTQENIIHFGVGKDSVIDQVEVVWPDGKKQVLANINSNQVLQVDHKNAVAAGKGSIKNQKSLLKDITSQTGIDFIHTENKFEDFDHEPLLPHRYSRNGPYLASGDIDGNGLEDFWMGGPAKINGKIFLQQPDGKFINKDMPDPGYEDAGGLLFDADGDKDLDLYVVSGGNEYNPLSAPYQDRLYINDGKGNFKRDPAALPVEHTSGSCVIGNDFDKDGDTDLFVGGRVIPTRYPFPPESFILLNNGKGRFQNATAQLAPEISNIGMVTTALWSDFDNDGYTDLILTGEGMPVTFFKNEKTTFRKSDAGSSVAAKKGWWFSIAAGDFDRDGDMDYVAGNIGLNTKLKPSEEHPVSVYGKDFNGNGRIQPIVTYYLKNKQYTVVNRDDIAAVIPSIKKKFDNYTKFAEAGFSEIYSDEELKDAHVLKATTFSSVYIENKGKAGFEMKDLPVQAQVSTIQSFQVHDFDKDGNPDILVAGNFYSPDFMTGRYDASIGLILKGDGKGGFVPLSSRESGVSLKGDVRSTEEIWIGKHKAIIAGTNSGACKIYKFEK